jgi:TPR repeat protein
LRSSDDKYLAILSYTGAQPENSVWTMTVGLANSVRALSKTASPSANPSPPATAATPTASAPTPVVNASATPQFDPAAYLASKRQSPFDPTKPYKIVSFEEIKPKAEAGDAASQYELGLLYAIGQGVPKDDAQAVKWYRKAAEQNLPQAQYELGLRYSNGNGVAKDSAEAAKWYRKAADQGLAAAQTTLAACYALGEGVSQDYTEAARWLRKAAEQNDAQAQDVLGNCYRDGPGVQKDDVEAAKWFRKAAEQNNAEGQYNLGGCYHDGEGVPKNQAEAVKWWRKAAEQNHVMAQHNLALAYAKGEGVRNDYVEAVKWFRKAAQQNDAGAQFSLGWYYYFGQGVPKNQGEAVKWFRKAAEQNHVMAQHSLGVCYRNGEGVPKNYPEAVKWFRKAAEQNYAEAQCNLAGLYIGGEGVPRNYVEAYKWLLLAAAQGNQRASKPMGQLESLMSREQVAEGQKLAQDFKPVQVSSAQAGASGTAAAQLHPMYSGTGFFITEDGYVITNEHVAGSDAPLRLVTASGLIPAKLVKVDASNDLALLKAEGKFETLPVVTSRTVKLGNTAVTVGFPNVGLQGFAPKFARGEIASLAGPMDDSRFFQISLPLQPGNSGGALVDERGNVIGVVSAKLSASATLQATGELPENVNYAVKSSFLLGFLESVPEVAAKLKEPNTSTIQLAEVVERAKKAAVLVLVGNADTHGEQAGTDSRK